MAKGLYLHLPFCKTICTYCDFPKLAGATNQIEAYVQALVNELEDYRDELTDVETVYLGGGTPSAIPTVFLTILFEKLASVLDLRRLTEFTIEANPSDVTAEFAKLLITYHVTRVSLGVQTFHPHLLAVLGRKEDADVVRYAIHTLKESGLVNLNLDFIYAIPGETIDELKTDLEFAVSLQPTHLSIYSLILEEKTKLMYEIKQGRMQPIDEDLEADMFELVRNQLPKAGYSHYEISNFALLGYESKHNLVYWNLDSYLGLGMGAHSQIGTIRFHNKSTLSGYLSAVHSTGRGWEAQDPCDLPAEFGIMGLRKLQGISLAEFVARFGSNLLTTFPRLQKNIEEGLCICEGDRFRLSPRGVLLLNYVERSFLRGV
jgi:oxygen-independent coproporphyrinogen-3 oxidase